MNAGDVKLTATTSTSNVSTTIPPVQRSRMYTKALAILHGIGQFFLEIGRGIYHKIKGTTAPPQTTTTTTTVTVSAEILSQYNTDLQKLKGLVQAFNLALGAFEKKDAEDELIQILAIRNKYNDLGTHTNPVLNEADSQINHCFEKFAQTFGEQPNLNHEDATPLQ